jgi:hypothetical protein
MAGSFSIPPAFDLAELAVLAPPALRDRLVVAGGYLASATLAKDIDLWLVSTQFPADLDAVGRHVYIPPREDTWQVWEPFVSVDDSELPPEYAAGNLGTKGIKYLGTFQKEGWPKPVQFFATTYATVEELLSDFDISTHQRAVYVNSRGPGQIWLPTTTSIVELPRVTNWSTPASTLERLERICRNYGFSPLDNHPDMDKLVASTEEARVMAF